MSLAPDAAEPDFPRFEARWSAGETAILHASRPDDLLTPVAAYLKLAASQDYAFLLESVEGGAWRGRYSAIGFDPDMIWSFKGETARLAASPEDVAARRWSTVSDPLASLEQAISATRCALPEGAPSIAAGLFGYLDYDSVRLIERLPDIAAPDPLDLPDGFLFRPRTVVVFDALRQEVQVFCPVRPRLDQTARQAYQEGQARIAAAFEALDGPVRELPPAPAGAGLGAIASNQTPEQYKQAVEKAKAYIRAGDAFQIVPSQRFSADFPAHPFALYRALRRLNPSPFLFFYKLDDRAITGSSPEILVRLRDGTVTVRPIAGTRKRGASPAEDDALEADLLADPKERAEHLMLLDLGRNDVGRVAKPGSVTVTSREIVERYSHVMHIVSNVEGEIAEDETALSALFAGFPAGTVSGAPKVRAMEIIDELEPHRRGVYAGAAGYFSADGGMDTCIALRTAVIKDGRLHVQAGAGVVLDSDPEAEHQECVNKARALFRAAELALED